MGGCTDESSQDEAVALRDVVRAQHRRLGASSRAQALDARSIRLRPLGDGANYSVSIGSDPPFAIVRTSSDGRWALVSRASGTTVICDSLSQVRWQAVRMACALPFKR